MTKPPVSRVPRKRYPPGMRTHLCLPGIRPHAVAMCGLKNPVNRTILYANVDCQHCIRECMKVRRDRAKKWRTR